MEGSDSSIILCIIPEFSLRDWRTLISIVGDLAEIRIGHFPNIS
jgi:hypothetical protein